jgi:translation initiation factor IF-3
MAHTDIGMRVLDRVRTDVSELAKVEMEPNFEGRQVTMVLAPR